jgi:hypothetical protein
MGNFAISDRAEEAFAALIQSAVTAAGLQNVLVGTAKNYIDINEQECVFAVADSGTVEPDQYGLGNFWLDVAIEIRSNAVQDQSGTGPDATPKNTSETLVTTVFNALCTSTITTDLSSAVADFTCMGALPQAVNTARHDRGAWINELIFRLYCCGSALAA